MRETDLFIISDVIPLMQESREMGSTRPPSKVGVKSASVKCKSCQNKWTARNGDGSLEGVLGGTVFICPKCRKSESVGGL